MADGHDNPTCVKIVIASFAIARDPPETYKLHIVSFFEKIYYVSSIYIKIEAYILKKENIMVLLILKSEHKQIRNVDSVYK